MKYKRFLDFYHDDKLMVFHTYLPIQLDAACHDFKHMALLSNEDTLYKQLSLECKEKNKKETSRDLASDF